MITGKRLLYLSLKTKTIYMDIRRSLFFAYGAFGVLLFLLIMIHLVGTPHNGTYYYLEGTDLVIKAITNADHSAQISFFHKGTDPTSLSNSITITPDDSESLIIVDPSNTNVVYVDSGISIDSFSDIEILHCDVEEFKDNADALKYWYSPEGHYLSTGSFDSSYDYDIRPVPSRIIEKNQSRQSNHHHIAFVFLYAVILMALYEWVTKLREQHRVKTAEKMVPKQMESIPENENVVYVRGIELSVLSDALSSFMLDSELEKVYSNVYKLGQYYVITTKLSFPHFASLVNYLRYCNEKKRYQVVGWYHMGRLNSSGPYACFSDNNLMLYIPDSDVDYDFVYIVTQDNRHYKSDLGEGGIISNIYSGTRSYESQEEFFNRINTL